MAALFTITTLTSRWRTQERDIEVVSHAPQGQVIPTSHLNNSPASNMVGSIFGTMCRLDLEIISHQDTLNRGMQ
jgi:hypothetical protein